MTIRVPDEDEPCMVILAPAAPAVYIRLPVDEKDPALPVDVAVMWCPDVPVRVHEATAIKPSNAIVNDFFIKRTDVAAWCTAKTMPNY